MAYRYRGYNGSAIVDDSHLHLIRSGFVAKISRLADRGQSIPLAEITEVVSKPPSVLFNGYLRIGVRGNPIRPMSTTDANSHPDALTFTYGQRGDFDRLLGWLEHVIQVNHGMAARTPEDLQFSRLGRSRTSDLPQVAATNHHEAADEQFPISNIPHSDQELADIVTFRPDHWEYRLFAGSLVAGIIGLEEKRLEYEFRYVRREVRLPDAAASFIYLSDADARLSEIISGAGRLLTERNNILAFGPPGTPGDPARIKILARRLVDIYEALLDWSAEVRRVDALDDLEEVFDLAAQLTDQPLRDMRRFVGRSAAEVDNLDQRQGLRLELVLSITTDRGLRPAYEQSLSRAKRNLRAS